MIAPGPCLVLLVVVAVSARENVYLPHRSYRFFEQRDRLGAMVHLMEWPYRDIKRECDYIHYWGYNAILISPPVEHLALDPPSWTERYMPLSLQLTSRSGSRDELVDTIQKCSKINRLRVFVDLNFNNMLKSTVDGEVTGTAGSKAKPTDYEYSEITKDEFNKKCKLGPHDYNDASKVRKCEVDDMQDLNNGDQSLMEKHVKLMKDIYDMGVFGFRISMAKYMYPEHLQAYYTLLNDTIKEENSYNDPPMVIHDVNGLEEGIVKPEEYANIGNYPQTVTDYTWSKTVSKYFFKAQDRSIDLLVSLGKVDIDKALVEREQEPMVFLYNHLTQNTEDPNMITRIDKMGDKAKVYRMAMAFMMSWPYGIPMVLSSYKGKGVPLNQNGTVKSPRTSSQITDWVTNKVTENFNCAAVYNCEHSDPITARMAVFNDEVRDEPLTQFKAKRKGQWFSYTRGNVGFIFFNAGDTDVQKTFTVSLRSGEYCDIASGDVVNNECTGRSVRVSNGELTVELKANDTLGYFAIQRASKLNPTAKFLAGVFGKKRNSSGGKTAPAATDPAATANNKDNTEDDKEDNSDMSGTDVQYGRSLSGGFE